MEKTKIKERQLVVFKVLNEEFGVDINKVNSIITMEKITKIPNAESYIEGVINLRGKIVVVINLHKKLHLEETDWNKNTRIIVIELEHDVLGMIVDSVTEVLRIEEGKIEEAPPVILEKIDADYLEGVGILGERLIILLNVEKVLHKKEIEHIQNLNKTFNEKNASEENYFWFHDGKSVKNIKELITEIEQTKDDVFSHHVNSEKNDFAAWIRHVLSDENLAKKLDKTTSKAEILKILKE